VAWFSFAVFVYFVVQDLEVVLSNGEDAAGVR
jgi:hypothetical protein